MKYWLTWKWYSVTIQENQYRYYAYFIHIQVERIIIQSSWKNCNNCTVWWVKIFFVFFLNTNNWNMHAYAHAHIFFFFIALRNRGEAFFHFCLVCFGLQRESSEQQTPWIVYCVQVRGLHCYTSDTLSYTFLRVTQPLVSCHDSWQV